MPGEEADRDGADGEPERVLLGDALGAARLVLDLVGVRCGVADGLAGATRRSLADWATPMTLSFLSCNESFARALTSVL